MTHFRFSARGGSALGGQVSGFRFQVSARARRHVEEMFSKEVVIPQMISMYEAVMKNDSGERQV